ncbi:unnamed protein product [Rotaria sp. Silwood2]|nr:unnamed protein product [Rotaria sp. Silwood2]
MHENRLFESESHLNPVEEFTKILKNHFLYHECSICENKLNETDSLWITDCNHIFHRTCAQDLLNKRGRTHCYFCHRKSALGDILFRNTTTTIKDPPEQNANPIKSDKTLGDVFIRVRNNQIKDRLIEDIQKTVLDSTGDTSMISFSNTNELISIIVIDRTNENKDIDLPKPEEILNQWIQTYNTPKPLSCDQVNIQFPNIYHIVSSSFDDLLNAMSNPNFLINSLFAHAYFGADCSFFEDLPKSTTKEQLQEGISNSIEMKNISSLSLHI